MRPRSHFTVDPTAPSARAVCDRCGQMWQHSQLSFQFQWVGPKLQNLWVLVCPPCLDKPQEQLRTIVLPPDPVPILNARPEDYVSDNNPLSGIGVSANFFKPQYGSMIGNLTGGGGINAAVDGNLNKPFSMSANNPISNSSYNNYVGVNWSGNVSNLAMPSSLKPPVLRHSLTSFTITAPNDRGFLGTTATSYVVQASPVDTSLYGAWTTISSGTTTGTPGESISADCGGPTYQFHRVAFLGDQLNPVAIAQMQLNVAQTGDVVTGGAS